MTPEQKAAQVYKDMLTKDPIDVIPSMGQAVLGMSSMEYELFLATLQDLIKGKNKDKDANT